MKYLLFDLDGTLTDPYEGITKSILYALKACGRETVDPEQLRRSIGPPIDVIFGDIFGLDEKTTQFAIAKYRERYGAVGLFENKLLDGVADTLRRLQDAGYVLAVASSKPKVFVDRILERFDIMRYFTVSVGSGLDGSLHNKTLVIREALRLLGRREGDAETVMIGDREHDIIGAKNCGLKSIGLNVGFAAPGELERAGADWIFSSFSELCEFFDKRN